MGRCLRFALLCSAVLAVDVNPLGDIVAHAQDVLPANTQRVLTSAAASGDRALIDAVSAAVAADPSLAQIIVDEAIRLNAGLAEEIVAAAVAAGGTVEVAAAVGPAIGLGPVLLGAAGLGAAGAGAAALGGGGGGGGSSPEAAPPPTTPPPSPPIVADEFAAQEGLSLIDAGEAYARGGTGEGIVIGVLDSGLDQTHPEFAGRIAPGGFDFVAGTPAVTDPNSHGTHVSGIAAASRNDSGMHGVAYNAQILPIRIGNADGSIALSDTEMAAAMDRAVSNNSRILNNSWGSSIPIVARSRSDIEASMPNELAAWGRAIANDVVVVFATGNDFATQPSVRSGLPHRFPEYQALWLAAMAVELDGGDPFYSNACGVAAAWCLAAPGGGITAGNPGVLSTVPVAQGSFGRKSGTSMAAPHVSGAVAVLMDLFPELTAQQIVARLLETADKTGIYANSAIFGQGLLDLDAATQPIGVAIVLTGETTRGTAHRLDASRVQLGAAFGDGLQQSLQGAKLAVFDKYHAAFVVDLGALVQIADSRTDVGAVLERFRTVDEEIVLGDGLSMRMRFAGGEASGGDPSITELSLAAEIGANSDAVFNYNKHPATSFGLHGAGRIDRSLVASDGAFFAPYLSFADQGYNMATGTTVPGLGTLRFGSFFGQSDAGTGEAFGSIAELAVSIGSVGEMSLQMGSVTERDTLLGSQTTGAFATDGAPTLFGGVTGEVELNETVSIVGSYFAGISAPRPGTGSLFSEISPIHSNAFSLGLIAEDVGFVGSKAGFVVNQPLRVSRAEAKLSLATGRTQSGTVLRQDFDADLEPGGREMDLEVYYEAPLGERTTIGASTMLRIEPGHVRDAEPEGVLLLRFDHKF